MATYTAVSTAEARALGALFGLDVATATGLSAGSVNTNVLLSLAGGGKAFLRVYEEQDAPGAVSEAALLVHLAARGLAVAPPLARLDGSGFVADLAGKPIAIFPWVLGEMRCQKSVRPPDAFAIGAALARVHESGSPTPREGRFTLERLRERCDRIEKADDSSLAAMADVLRRLLDEVASQRLVDAPHGLCHGDLFRDNVLWQGDEISALLDFESAADGPFAFDLAVTMLAWCVGDDLDPALARALFDGYRSVRPIDAELARSLFPEARLAALRFTTTRITDYAMRAHLGANVPRDWKRFWSRHERLVALGEDGLSAMLGIKPRS